jgi:hypothetical protein
MDIRFVSSLTIDDENRLAPALLQAVVALLRAMPLAYTVRIETAGGEVFEHQQAPLVQSDAAIHHPRPRQGSATITPFRY